METNERPTARRDRILASAEAEFAAHGFSGARVDRIAATASVNKQLLFHYFESKAGLYQAVTDSLSKRYDLESRPGSTPAEQLRRLVEQLVRAACGHRRLLPDEWRSMAVRTAAGIIEDGQRSGNFRDDADPMSIAQIVVAASLGCSMIDVSMEQDPSWPLRFVAALAQMVVDHCNWK
jgi:TetR/AcrR family transcriptional regulator